MMNWRRILPLLLYVALIFVVSSIPSLTPPGPTFFLQDKIAHVVEYLILGVLLFKGIGWEVSRGRVATFGFLLAVGTSIGALDEIYQSYIPGRSMDIHDWYADCFGVALGCGLFVFTRLGRARGSRVGPGERRHARGGQRI